MAAGVAAYQAGAIVAVPSTAGSKHGRQETQEIARQALELAASKRSKATASAQTAQGQTSSRAEADRRQQAVDQEAEAEEQVLCEEAEMVQRAARRTQEVRQGPS